MNILGVSAGFHDAAAAVISPQGDILFAGHSERYSRRKNDANFCQGLLNDILPYGPDVVAYYERPWLKQLRQFYNGQGIERNKLTLKQILRSQLGGWINLNRARCFGHHLCHAAAGFQTSPFDQATVVVIDAIGEWDTATIWAADYNRQGHARYRKLWSQRYPHSIGLFYSAMTQRVGLKPLDEEYILMGMAAYGQPGLADRIKSYLVTDSDRLVFKNNLHTGVSSSFLDSYSDFDIARGAQDLLEELVMNVMSRAAQSKYSANLVYMGGVALNCVANARLGEHFDRIWIMPCPGDAGSSIGAAALYHRGQVVWRDSYLGHDIGGDYPVAGLVNELAAGNIVGVASGRAEFGPRALGNRSLLADPRGPDIKDRVNQIKQRQKFRPFAPVILEEHVSEYFDMPRGWSRSDYMQTIARCLQPDQYPAIVHKDGTSRVQTVPKNNSGIRRLLEAWYGLTGCPMLLNTSLNIRGQPMVNNRADANKFENTYNIRVLS